MSEKIKAIRGNKERAKDVVKWLESQGAENAITYACENDDLLYFVHPDGCAKCIESKYYYFFDIEELPLWRAKQGERYYYVTSEGLISAAIEDGSFDSSMRYNVGNYFQTDENAVPYREKFIQLFRRNRWK